MGDHVEEVELEETTCASCGAAIVVYPVEYGLLPDEVVGDRRAAHHWRACELHRRLRALGDPFGARVPRGPAESGGVQEHEAPPVPLSSSQWTAIVFVGGLHHGARCSSVGALGELVDLGLAERVPFLGVDPAHADPADARRSWEKDNRHRLTRAGTVRLAAGRGPVVGER